MSDVKCPLCGMRFDALENTGGCANCSLFKSCELLQCPNCKFEFPIPDKKLLQFLKQLRQKNNSCKEGICK